MKEEISQHGNCDSLSGYPLRETVTVEAQSDPLLQRIVHTAKKMRSSFANILILFANTQAVRNFSFKVRSAYAKLKTIIPCELFRMDVEWWPLTLTL
jgi:hypothetical protein